MALARSANSDVASSSDNGGTGYSCSPDRWSRSRLDVIRSTLGAAAESSPSGGAASGRSCSRLSSTSNARLVRRCSARASAYDALPALTDAERLGDGREHKRRIGERGKPNEPNAVGVLLDELGRGLQAQSCLAAAAGSGEGEQADVVTSEEFENVGELALASEERCRLHRKVRLIERLQRRELGITELIDALGRLEILQSVEPEVENGRIDELPRRLGQQHLRPVCGRRDACSFMDVATDIPLVREDRLAGVDPHTNFGRARREAILSDPRRLYGIEGSSEGEEERVTLRVDLDTPVSRGGLAQDPAVLGEHLDVRVAQFMKQAGRALDVREDKRDRSRWEIGSHVTDDA